MCYMLVDNCCYLIVSVLVVRLCQGSAGRRDMLYGFRARMASPAGVGYDVGDAYYILLVIASVYNLILDRHHESLSLRKQLPTLQPGVRRLFVDMWLLQVVVVPSV
ncbi:hypothetical protein B5X24_HaOG214413 [Helicoverpa armigera]|nr:hypothetical protein B5X24_HaOG214413 [Helicoverpa armigera]